MEIGKTLKRRLIGSEIEYFDSELCFDMAYLQVVDTL